MLALRTVSSASERIAFLAAEKVKADWESHFLSSLNARPGSTKLDLYQLVSAIQFAGFMFSNEAVFTMFKKLDTDGDGYITKSEFMSSVTSPYSATVLFDAFQKADSNRHSTLSPGEFYKALVSLGVYDITEIGAAQLLKRKVPGVTSADFDLFVKLTAPMLLFMHRQIPLPTVASWDEHVLYTHYMFGVMGAALYSSLPKPPSSYFDAATMNNTTSIFLPLVYQLQKTGTERLVDVITMGCLVAWGVTFHYSLKLRGKTRKWLIDVLSMAFAFFYIVIMMYALNKDLIVVFVIGVLACVGLLWKKED
ncbi:unnamed protein product [Microthlaspi erraticum]|uniref:EF-hand domain-containing protein n=1 Tax=Microthlaspi erraticum TaxID=1685480 RepID=A0A6D2J9V7_9BRAS|nr:unnamed protein product [Microthlaspi erraticum]